MGEVGCCRLFSWLPHLLPLSELQFFTEVAQKQSHFSIKSFNITS